MPVVFELNQSKFVDQPIRRIAGNQINLPAGKRLIAERQIHLARRLGELESVHPSEAWITVFSRHEILSETSSPTGCISRRVRDGLEIQSAGFDATHQNRKRVIEAERLEPFDIELRLVIALHLIVDLARIAYRFVLQDSGERRAGVLDVHINLAGEQFAVTKIAAQF